MREEKLVPTDGQNMVTDRRPVDKKKNELNRLHDKVEDVNRDLAELVELNPSLRDEYFSMDEPKQYVATEVNRKVPDKDRVYKKLEKLFGNYSPKGVHLFDFSAFCEMQIEIGVLNNKIRKLLTEISDLETK